MPEDFEELKKSSQSTSVVTPVPSKPYTLILMLQLELLSQVDDLEKKSDFLLSHKLSDTQRSGPLLKRRPTPLFML